MRTALIAIITLSFIFSCSKKNGVTIISVSLTTDPVVGITGVAAKLNGTISGNGSGNISKYGLLPSNVSPELSEQAGTLRIRRLKASNFMVCLSGKLYYIIKTIYGR